MTNQETKCFKEAKLSSSQNNGKILLSTRKPKDKHKARARATQKDKNKLERLPQKTEEN